MVSSLQSELRSNQKLKLSLKDINKKNFHYNLLKLIFNFKS